ncbi:MAG TPA: DUF1801 domain-containing protein [Actinomycetota bacterium]|nr:DUF1801 domain-containing protein [Actinomycetota bacterium]
MTSVDDFIVQKVPPEFHDVVSLVRRSMAEGAPEATEKISYGMLMWAGRWPLAWISPTKKDITFGFRAGAYFDDPYGLLKGTGKHARHVKLKTVEAADQEALRHYIQQAVANEADL